MVSCTLLLSKIWAAGCPTLSPPLRRPGLAGMLELSGVGRCPALRIVSCRLFGAPRLFAFVTVTFALRCDGHWSALELRAHVAQGPVPVLLSDPCCRDAGPGWRWFPAHLLQLSCASPALFLQFPAHTITHIPRPCWTPGNGRKCLTSSPLALCLSQPADLVFGTWARLNAASHVHQPPSAWTSAAWRLHGCRTLPCVLACV